MELDGDLVEGDDDSPVGGLGDSVAFVEALKVALCAISGRCASDAASVGSCYRIEACCFDSVVGGVRRRGDGPDRAAS
jgi:galactokinase/mevalonate kinase-like predicted kinase